MIEDEHSPFWHRWQDKQGLRQLPCYLAEGYIDRGKSIIPISTNKQLIDSIATNKLFMLCDDVLKLDYVDELIGDDKTIPYISRNGNISAIRVSMKRGKTGFIIPSKTWGFSYVDTECASKLMELFGLFNLQKPTPASLSEAIFRRTLGEKIYIRRPSISLRDDILQNSSGGRIDVAESWKYYPDGVYEYDQNKGHLDKTLEVVDPSVSPVWKIQPDLKEIFGFPAGFWHVEMIGRYNRISPIQINGKSPDDGEIFDKWLWSEELEDCLEASYIFRKCFHGYGFRALTHFMTDWASELVLSHSMVQDEKLKEIIKTMMVGLPGRFLRQPEIFTLIPISEATKEDTPLLLHYSNKGDKICSDYAIRAEYDRESTALSQVGSFIFMKQRHELYQRMIEEKRRGNYVIRSYIDSFTTVHPAKVKLGTSVGQWKEKRYVKAYTEENRFIGELENGVIEIKAPGFPAKGRGQETRIEMLQRYRKAEQNG